MKEGSLGFGVRLITSHCSETTHKNAILRVFEKKNLMRIFGLKRGENGEWRRLQNEQLLPFT